MDPQDDCGVISKRPPQPKCSFLWDVETVLDNFWELPDNNYFFDKLLTLKLVMFLALTSASGASEVTNLDLKYFIGFKILLKIFLSANSQKLAKRVRVPLHL